MRRRPAKAAISAIVFVVLVLGAAPRPALAQETPWFRGDHEVLLGYGCTNFWLEPVDLRFPCAPGERVHEGVDFDMAVGTPVYAGLGATVLEVGGRETHDYGPHYIKLWLDSGVDLVLGHLSRADVAVGEHVSPGTLVGLSGDLGECNWPNLHFEARVHEGTTYQSVDPASLLAFVRPEAISHSFVAMSAGVFERLALAHPDGEVEAGGQMVAPRAPVPLLSTPVLARDAQGQLNGFAIGSDGKLWTVRESQSSPMAPAAWSPWWTLSRPVGGLVGVPSVTLDRGRLLVSAAAPDGRVWSVRQEESGGGWAWWVETGRLPVMPDGGPARDLPIASGDRIYAVSAAGAVWALSSTGWLYRGCCVEGRLQAADMDGTTALFARRGDRFLVTFDGSAGWSRWRLLGGRWGSDPAPVRTSDGRVVVFGLDSIGRLAQVEAGWPRSTVT